MAQSGPYVLKVPLSTNMAILITKTKTRTKVIAIRLLKLKYSKKN